MSADFSNQPIVIDNGSGTIKAGFAGADTPTLMFPSLYVIYFYYI